MEKKIHVNLKNIMLNIKSKLIKRLEVCVKKILFSHIRASFDMYVDATTMYDVYFFDICVCIYDLWKKYTIRLTTIK